MDKPPSQPTTWRHVRFRVLETRTLCQHTSVNASSALFLARASFCTAHSFSKATPTRTMSQASAVRLSTERFPNQSQYLGPACPAPSQNQLKEVFAMLREAWARDFLFNMDAGADVCVLTNPVQLQYGLIIDCVAQLFEAEGDYHGMFSMRFECRWLIVPVASIGEHNAMTVVQSHEAFREANPCHRRKITAVLRMLQNSSNGDLLLCWDELADNLVTLMLFSRRSPARRQRVLLRFKRDACLASLSSPLGPDFSGMFQALAFSRQMFEFYHCPSCNSAASGIDCNCIFEVKRPSHPLDFSPIRANVLYHCGIFSGFCNLNLLSKGVRYATACLSSTINVTTCFELGLIRRLVERGIKSKLGTCSRVPSFLSCSAEGKQEEACLAETQVTPEIQNSERSSKSIAEGILPVSSTRSTVDGTGISSMASVPKAPPLIPGPGPLLWDAEADRGLRRQIQNRISAARSNQRRKERLEALEQNLLSIRTKKRELEQRQAELKAENSYVRKLLITPYLFRARQNPK